jgi:hypothetical protein
MQASLGQMHTHCDACGNSKAENTKMEAAAFGVAAGNA